MKKLLLASTALLGAVAFSGEAAAQAVTTRAPFTLSIGGMFSTYFGVNSGNDEGLTANKKNYDLLTEQLLQFAASAKTDNGLTYGAALRKYYNAGTTAGVNQPNGDYDRAGIFISGSFGRIDLGDVNSVRASLLLPTGLNAVGPAWGNGLGPDGGLAGIFYNRGATSIAGNITSPGNYTTVGVDSTQRRTKINYTTPDFGGFQAGIAYIPTQNGSGNNFDRTDTIANVATAYNGGRGTTRDIVELGAKYTFKFSSVEVTPHFGYLHGTANKSSTGLSMEDADSIFAGLKVGYMGFEGAIGYSNSFKSTLAKTNAVVRFNDSTEGLVVALGYVTGPWAVSAYYQYVTQEGNQTVSGNDTFRAFEIAGGYTLAPGLQLWSAVHNFEFKDGDLSTKANGTLFLLGTTLSF